MTPPSHVCLLSAVTRSGREESWHHGAAVVVRGGRLQRAFGDPTLRSFTRSAIKPLQALPVLELGIADRFGFDDRELAVLCASHDGGDAHVAAVRSMMAKGGIREADLRCGPHAPFDRGAAQALARSGRGPERIHNNCSGKHAGFLLLARELGVPLASYLDPESASQRLVRESVAAMSGLLAGDLDVGVDGCGAPTLGMPLAALAAAFWRLANPIGLPPARAAACQRLLAAIAREPVLLAGEGRLGTALVRTAPGRIWPKNGAEGVYAVGVSGDGGQGFGLAVKVADGAERGYLPVVVDALHRLGLWPQVPAELADFHRVPVRNTQKVLVGHVASVLPW